MENSYLTNKEVDNLKLNRYAEDGNIVSFVLTSSSTFNLERVRSTSLEKLLVHFFEVDRRIFYSLMYFRGK